MRVIPISTACIFFVALGNQVHAQSDTYSGAYLCIQEFGGGISWDEGTKKWGGTRFNATGKVVLKLDPVSTRIVKNFLDEDIQVTDYQVTVTAMGEDFASPCSPRQGDYTGPVTVGDRGWVGCTASFTDYSFNLSNLRYLEAYMVGYISGVDNNENTPAMMGGTCAKIQ